MALEAFGQHFHEHAFRAAAEVGAKTVGEQQRRSRQDDPREPGVGLLSAGEADGGEAHPRLRFLRKFLPPVVVGGIADACILQVRLDRLATLLQVQL